MGSFSAIEAGYEGFLQRRDQFEIRKSGMGVGSASLLDFLISDRKTRHLVVHPRHAFARRSAPVNSLKSDLGGNRNDTFRRLNQLVDHTQERPWDREASASHSGRSGSSALPGFACALAEHSWDREAPHSHSRRSGSVFELRRLRGSGSARVDFAATRRNRAQIQRGKLF